MPENVNHCPLCKGDRSDLFDQREFRGAQVLNRICLSCGFVYQSPRMTDSELDDFYAREYRQVYQGDEGPTQKDLLIQELRASSLLDFVKDSVHKVDRHLDIGCSAGILLEKIQNHFGNDVVGVEPGQAYQDFTKQKKIKVYSDLESVNKADEGRFDLISMAHVLEHIPDPGSYLANLREKYLAPNGWLLLEVPNLYFHDSFEMAHLSSFSLHTLGQTLSQSGFDVVAHKAHGNPRSAIFPLYLTVLARPSDSDGNWVVKPERNVRLKRTFCMLVRKVFQRLVPNLAWVPLKSDLKK